MTKARDLANGGFGLVLVKPSSVVNGTDNGKGTVSFSAVSSVSLNGVFSSTYDNYHIQIRVVPSGSTYLTMRLRVSGSDNSTNNYVYSGITTVFNSSTISSRRSSSAISRWETFTLNTTSNSIVGDFRNPNAATETFANWTHTPSGGQGEWTSALFTQTNQFDGLTIAPDSGTITGTISIYGINK